MEINGVSPVSGPNQVNPVQSKTSESATSAAETKATTQPQDVVDVSAKETGAAQAADAMDTTFSGVRVNGIRQDLVNRVRAEIAAGTYDTPEKLEIALERLLGKLEE